MQHIKHIQRINPNPENRFSQPILKDGLVLEDIMLENETKRKSESKIIMNSRTYVEAQPRLHQQTLLKTFEKSENI